MLRFLTSVTRRTAACLTIVIPAAAMGQSGAPPIMDNSFLVEEAYNQEPGVVQHVTTFARTRDLDGWLGSFTQEWPLGSLRHQVSFTVPVVHDGLDAGVGDIALHYRRQLRQIRPQLAIAPRVSLVLPTGSRALGRGKGSPALEVALPVSYMLNARFVAHTNGGLTITPAARGLDGVREPIMETFIGQSLIFLAHQRLNVLAEVAWDVDESVVSQGVVERTESFFFSPGVRGAIDVWSDVQIVPGLAFPIGLGASRGDRALFVYLSVEHAFRR